MRHEMVFKNSLYMHMLEETDTLKKDDSLSKSTLAPFGVLYKMWCDGAFDDYSDEHFIIRSIDEDIDYFKVFLTVIMYR